MPAVRIYLRNSSDGQAKAATTRAQRPDCYAVAARFAPGWPIVEYVDEGVSGDAPLAERRDLQRLLRDLQPGDLVIAFAQDRLSRSDDMIEHAAVFGVLQRKGCIARTVEPDAVIDTRDQIGRLLAQLQADEAAKEKRRIAARTAAGKRTAVALGRKPQGATPYGLTWSRAGGWAIDEERAAVVRQAFDGIVDGRSCADVAASLPGPAPRAASWGARGVWQLVTRRTYLGEWHFAGQVIAVPPIVDAVTWQAAQAALLAGGRRGLRRTSHVYLCDEGVGRCADCGGPLRVRWGGRASRTSYYRCPACGGRWWRTAELDAEVWARIVRRLVSGDVLAEAIAGAREAGVDAGAAESQAQAFAARLERLAAHEAAVLARHRRGLVSEAAMDAELGVIARERRLLEQSAAAARQEAAQARAGAAELEGLQQAARVLGAELERLEGAERREAVRGLRTVVEVGAEVLVRFRLVAGVSCAVGGCSSARTAGESDTTASDGAPGGIVVVA